MIRSTWLTFENYPDLISTSWNVENDILSREEFVTPERRRKGKILVNSFLSKSGRISGQFLAGYLAGLACSFEKKIDLATALNPASYPVAYPARFWPDSVVYSIP